MDSAKRDLTSAIARAGGVEMLPDAPDGPVLEDFDPAELANLIEREVARAWENGWTKVSLHMDLRDARLLAEELRR